MAFKHLEDYGVRKVRDGRGVGLKTILGGFGEAPAELSDPDTANEWELIIA